MSHQKKKPENFFDVLRNQTLGGERKARLEHELQDHLEDAADAGDPQPLEKLGDPSETSALYNRVVFERDGIVLGIQGLLLACFSILIQLMTVWLISGFLSQIVKRFTELPLSFATNPSSLFGTLVYVFAFPWIFVAFWIVMARARDRVGNTAFAYALIALLYAGSVLLHLTAHLYDANAHTRFFPDGHSVYKLRRSGGPHPYLCLWSSYRAALLLNCLEKGGAFAVDRRDRVYHLHNIPLLAPRTGWNRQ